MLVATLVLLSALAVGLVVVGSVAVEARREGRLLLPEGSQAQLDALRAKAQQLSTRETETTEHREPARVG